MSISFHCPKCKGICAFHDKHSGRRARCCKCNQIFIIPSKNGEKAKKVKIQWREEGPISGFYRAVFVDNWKMFLNSANITGFVFVIAAVAVKFFIKQIDYSIDAVVCIIYVPFGSIIHYAAWGCLFWYYMQIIYSTAFEEEVLPDVYMGHFNEFVWNILRSVYTFIIAVFIVEIPFIITFIILRKMGIEQLLLLKTIALLGLFIFPIVLFTISIGRDFWMLIRPDYLFRPILKAFLPYLVVTGFILLAGVILYDNKEFYPEMLNRGYLYVAMHFCYNIIGQIMALAGVRSAGLFYRHYSCYLRW